MYRYIKSNIEQLPQIHVTFYIEPIFYEDSEVFASVQKVYDKDKHKYKLVTDNNPSRIINGPLSDYGEELENPIKNEFERFLDDCEDVIRITGFTIIDKKQSTESKKSEYFLLIGLDNTPCGDLVVDFRISDHVLDKYSFPEEWKHEALKYLTMNKILDNEAKEAGIDFKLDGVVVGTVKDDTWDKAINRLYTRLKLLRSTAKMYIDRNNKNQEDDYGYYPEEYYQDDLIDVDTTEVDD